MVVIGVCSMNTQHSETLQNRKWFSGEMYTTNRELVMKGCSTEDQAKQMSPELLIRTYAKHAHDTILSDV